MSRWHHWTHCRPFTKVNQHSEANAQGSNTVTGNDIEAIVTDFDSHWYSEVGNMSSVYPDTMHNLLAFSDGDSLYTTGVNNGILDANGHVYSTQTEFRAFIPISATSNNAGQGAVDDGSTGWAGQVYPTPGGDVSEYLTDGLHGLGFSTFANNVGGTFVFNVLEFDTSHVDDGTPDIIYFNNDFFDF